MYVKINLLPKSYYEAKSARNLCIIFAVILLTIIGVGIFWQIQINNQIRDLDKKIEIANGYKKQIDAIEGEISQRQQEVAYYQVRVDAIEGVLDFNKTIPAPFYEVAKWTYEKVQYTSLSISGSQVAIRGRARTINDIARYILNLYKAKDSFNPGTISLSVDGMGSANPSGMGDNGMPGMPGSMPGMPGATPAAPSPAMAGGSQFNAGAIAAPALGGGPAGMPGSPDMNGMPGMGLGDNMTLGNYRSGTWINFTVSAQLKKGLPSHRFSLSGSESQNNGMNSMNGMGMDGMGMPGGPMGGPMPGGPMGGSMPGGPMPGSPTSAPLPGN